MGGHIPSINVITDKSELEEIYRIYIRIYKIYIYTNIYFSQLGYIVTVIINAHDVLSMITNV